tara:strand:+ start:3329 stop:3601 length:273 start_codon:yes stop_codon:yes gene_type:complete
LNIEANINRNSNNEMTEEESNLWQLESDEEFLNRVYKSELGREPDSEGFKYWLDDLNLRGQTRKDVLANIRRSEEYKQRQLNEEVLIDLS